VALLLAAIGIIVILLGIIVILLGMIVCTDRVDNHWRNRGTVNPSRAPSRPFRYSHTQCVDCGKDEDLLSIDTGQCLVCFGVAHG
jgi:hypothetical protein